MSLQCVNEEDHFRQSHHEKLSENLKRILCEKQGEKWPKSKEQRIKIPCAEKKSEYNEWKKMTRAKSYGNKIEVLVRDFGKGCGIQFKRNKKTFKQEMDMI